MNLFRLHNNPAELKGSDIIPAIMILKLTDNREEIMAETGEILDTEMIEYMKGMTPNEKVEEYILTGTYTSALIIAYAGHVLKRRWPEGEEVIKDDAYEARRYAMMFNFRFKAAEPYIMERPEQAYYYAEDIIEGRWKEAEPYIKKSERVWPEYCERWGIEE